MTLANTPKLDALRKRIMRICADRGKKAELARYLDISMVRVSQWIFTKNPEKNRQPGGEITLRLLEWVRAEESKQQKCPGSALTPPERKTRLGKSHNETPKPGPK